MMIPLQVVATTEHPGGIIVDPHNLIAFEDFPYASSPWDSGWHAVTNPAHETYGEDGVIWSSVALQRHNQEDNTMESKVRSGVQEFDNIKEAHIFRERFTKSSRTLGRGRWWRRSATRRRT